MQNQLQRTIGIIAGIVVIAGVGGVTIYQENNIAPINAPINTSNIESTTTQTITSTVVSTVKTPVSKTTPTTKTVTTYKTVCTGAGGGEDDDGGAVQTCTKVPVTTTVPVNSIPTPAPAPVGSTAATPPVATVPKQYSTIYKNGTYSATGSYGSPGGTENISVTLTLTNDIITDITVTPGAYDRRSQSYQNIFISNYKQYVVGKNIASVNLGKISSSSLTPIGFNDALAQIKANAKV